MRWSCAGRAFAVGTLLLSLLAGCQQFRGGEAIDRELIGEVMMHAEFAANLRALAMPGGRLTGTPNADAAIRYVSEKTRAYGLQNVHSEPFDMSCWIVNRTRATVLSDPPRVLDGAVALARTQSTPAGGVTAEVIDVGDGKEADFAAHAQEVAGKFALVRDSGGPRGERLTRALEYGAVGMVVMMAADRDPVIGNGHHVPRPEPAIVMKYDADLVQALAAGTAMRLNVQIDACNWDCRPSNVVAEIPGIGPHADEVVLIGAHLDSWHLAEGAIDNGNGSTTILETARALTHVGWQPQRTVRFVWFMAEELGLDGSENYVRQHAAELDHVVAMLNVDMPGAPRKFGIFGHPEVEPFLKALRADLAGYEIEEDIGQWSGEGSDYSAFMRAGVCAVSLAGEIGPGVKNYHTTSDKYEGVDRRATVQSAAVYAVLVRRLADAPVRPTVRRPPASGGGS
jgi:carboxypeptidase Q